MLRKPRGLLPNRVICKRYSLRVPFVEASSLPRYFLLAACDVTLMLNEKSAKSHVVYFGIGSEGHRWLGVFSYPVEAFSQPYLVHGVGNREAVSFVSCDIRRDCG